MNTATISKSAISDLPLQNVNSEKINSLNSPVTAVERTRDSKLSSLDSKKHMSATHVSQKSCPTACPFFGKGCYAEAHMQGIHTRNLNSNTGDYTLDELARLEADLIDGLSGNWPLRLHIVGDSKTQSAASIVSAAAERYMTRGGQRVYSYTHAWKEVPRSSWGKVSILASTETPKEAQEAYDKGYAAAMVVDKFEKETAYPINEELTGIPCPFQTGKVKSCSECGLCLIADKLREKKRVILFAAHGGGGGENTQIKKIIRAKNSE